MPNYSTSPVAQVLPMIYYTSFGELWVALGSFGKLWEALGSFGELVVRGNQNPKGSEGEEDSFDPPWDPFGKSLHKRQPNKVVLSGNLLNFQNI